jgi:hypothetical protein
MYDMSDKERNGILLIFIAVCLIVSSVFSAMAIIEHVKNQGQGSDRDFTDNKSIISTEGLTCPPPITLWEQSK